jgi:hypothetical protein
MKYDPTKALDPRCGKAMKEISDIIDRYDLMACITIASPQACEFYFKVDPSFSFIMGVEGGYRVRSVAKDYGGNLAAKQTEMRDTISALVDIEQGLSAQLKNIQTLLDPLRKFIQ